jgi:homoserine kinase
MADIISFPDKKNEKNLAKAHEDMLIEEHRVKLMTLYSQMEHVLKEINYHKEVIRLLEKGNK